MIIQDAKFQGKNLEFKEGALELLLEITINFSGAAMAKLRSKIISYHIANKKTHLISKRCVLLLTGLIAKYYQISVGTYQVPQLYHNPVEANFNSLFLRKPILTGRAMVRLFSDNDLEEGISIEQIRRPPGGLPKKSAIWSTMGNGLGLTTQELIPV